MAAGDSPSSSDVAQPGWEEDEKAGVSQTLNVGCPGGLRRSTADVRQCLSL